MKNFIINTRKAYSYDIAPPLPIYNYAFEYLGPV